MYSADFFYVLESVTDIFFLIFMIFYFVIILLMIVSLWKIYEKAGEPGWASIVPVYGRYVLMKISCKNYWLWFLLLFAPIANYAAIVVASIGLGRSFGKDTGFILLLIFLPFVALPWVAFSDAEYDEFFRFDEI